MGEELLHDEARENRPRGLLVLGVHADVSDLCVGHCDDLTRVRGIRQDLLVARHARIEADLTHPDPRGAESSSAVDRSICEDKERGRLKGGAGVHGASTPRATSYTRRPSTRVIFTWPVNVCPAQGELRLLEKPLAGS